MQKTSESDGSGALYFGRLIVIVSMVLWSEYKTYYLGAWIALYVGGFVLWSIGFASTRHLTSAGPKVKSELAGSSGKLCLKAFYLNGYFFQPVEQETSNGQKQFRLSATPPLSPDHEAAVIRYLINQGLSDEMWPPISSRIEEEANWAFFM